MLGASSAAVPERFSPSGSGETGCSWLRHPKATGRNPRGHGKPPERFRSTTAAAEPAWQQQGDPAPRARGR